LTLDDPLIPTPLDATTPLEENEVNEHKRRPHMKNKGIYYVTTPIFYVNGGINQR
jgi:hypothetical protein